MEVACSSDTLVHLYQTTGRRDIENRILRRWTVISADFSRPSLIIIQILYDVTLCRWATSSRRFGGT